MRLLVAVLAGGAAAAISLAPVRSGLVEFIGRYVRPAPGHDDDRPRFTVDRAAATWASVGGLVGILLAQGDLFVGGAGRPVPALAILGMAGGLVAWSARRSTMRERAARQLRHELPMLCDALALQIVSGESVASAVANVADSAEGVGARELCSMLDRADVVGLDVALDRAGRTSAHPEARRLYELLAHAHLTGGRLADALLELGSDIRAGLERDLTSESGRRMVTTYGPVLALMVPTALLFLLYPTLLGLRDLSGGP